MSIPKDIQKIRSILNVMNVEYEGQVENQLLEFTHRTFVSFRICFLVILSNARRREKNRPHFGVIGKSSDICAQCGTIGMYCLLRKAHTHTHIYKNVQSRTNIYINNSTQSINETDVQLAIDRERSFARPVERKEPPSNVQSLPSVRKDAVRSRPRRVEEQKRDDHDDQEMDVDENDNLSVSNEVSKFVSGEVSERNNVLEPDRKRVTIEIKL